MTSHSSIVEGLMPCGIKVSMYDIRRARTACEAPEKVVHSAMMSKTKARVIKQAEKTYRLLVHPRFQLLDLAELISLGGCCYFV